MDHLAMLPDVDFDHGAASAAADACRETARALRTTTGERQRGAGHARRHWTGRHAERFDDVHEALRIEAESLLDQLDATARRIEDAAADARAEQRRRVRENADRRRHNALLERQGPR